LLYPTSMTRVEVIAPSDEVDEILRSVGKLGVAHFINLPKVKAQKYGGVAEAFETSEREDNLAHLSNRINSTLKKLGRVPHPRPLPLKGDSAAVLREVEEQLRGIELKVAEVENLMKEVTEKRASFERSLSQFNEDFQGAKNALSEYGLNLANLTSIDRRALSDREIIKDIHSKLLDLQKTLVYVDVAGKLTISHGELPLEEKRLREIYDEVSKAFLLTERTQKDLPEAREQVAKLESILRETKEAVEKKLEAIDKLASIRRMAEDLKVEMEGLKGRLSGEIVSTLGANFWASVTESIRILDAVKGLTLGSPGVEEAIRGVWKNTQEILKGFEVLLNIDKYLTLSQMDAIINAVRKEQPPEIESMLEQSRRLLATAPMKHLKTLERALEILDIERRIKVLSEEHPKLLKRLGEIAETAANLHAYGEAVDIELRIEDVKKGFMRTSKTAIFEVWLKKFDVQRATDVIRRASPSAVLNITGEEKGDKPPSVLRNPTLARAYERLVAAYGLPNYHELDPTIIMVLSFPIIFGMMFGDIGHGIIVTIGGFLIKPVFDKFKLQGEMLDPLYKGRILIISCGIMATFFGLLYGACFGPTFIENHALANGPYWYTHLTGLTRPLWFGPAEVEFGGPIVLLKVAVIVGIIQITFGILLDLINKLRHKAYKHCLGPASWLWFYGSLSYLILSRGFGVGKMISEEPVNFVLFLIVPFVGMIALHIFAEGPMEGFSEAIMKGIESISNTISYGRIMALGIVHALFSLIALMGWGSIMFIPIFLLVTILMIIALEGIITFAHTLRLHWVEWFSKFYKGDGIQFEGFQIERRFTTVP